MNPMLALPAAFGLGMLHALEPGHGKTLVTTYLVGNRGRISDALLLGGGVALSHTISVTVIAALVTGFFSVALPETNSEIHRWLEVGSGGLILLVAVMMVYRLGFFKLGRFLPREKKHADSDGDCEHMPTDCGCHHDHEPPSNIKDVLMLGLASGLCPSPLPLAFVASALALGQFAEMSQWLLYLFVFSVGMATTVSLMGVVLILSKQYMMKRVSSMESLEVLKRRFAFVPQAVGVMATVVLGVFGLYLLIHGLMEPADGGHVPLLNSVH